MPKFSYKAINESGNTITGVIEADSPELATNMIAGQGYIPTKVTRGEDAAKGAGLSSIKERFATIKTADVILLTKQFRTLLRAGIPILKLLQVLENQAENSAVKKFVISLSHDINGGASLYEAFSKHPKVVTPLYCNMLRAGESSGALPEVMNRIIYITEHEQKIKSDIKSALQYHFMVTIFLGVAFFVLLTFVMPKFIQIFKNAGLTLPLPTKICMYLDQLLSNYWYIFLGALIGGIVALIYYFRTEQGKYFKDSLFLKLPLIGPLVLKAAMSRFASIFAILQASGIHVLESIDILSGTIGNTAISREFDQIKEKIEEGRGIADPLRSAKYFTPMVINMLAIGEESGNLEEILNEVSIHYDEEVEYSTKRMSEAIGPILTIGLAAVIGFFALAIFLPMWDLTKMVKVAG